jgi:hypothetical protein
VKAPLRAGRRRVAFALLVAAALAGCGGGSAGGPDLGALKADPLGRYAERNDGGFLSKPTPASYRRLFAVADGDAALAAAAEAARAAGWTVDEPVAGLGVTGRKQLPGGSATMSASLLTDPAAIPGGTPPPVLSLSLEHSRS